MACEYCPIFKIHKLDFENESIEVTVTSEGQNSDLPKELKKIKKKLAQNDNKKEKKLRKIMKNLICLMGQGQKVKTIPEAVAKLLARNYPDIVKWNGDSKLVVFIPDFYLNKAVKYIDPSRGSELKSFCNEAAESNPEQKVRLCILG